PLELGAGPGALGRIGVDDRAVPEDPAVHHESGDHAQLDGERVVALAARGAEVLPQLVVGGVDPPGGVHQVPGVVDHRVTPSRARLPSDGAAIWSRTAWGARNSTRSPQKASHISFTAASRRRFASRGTMLWSSSSWSDTSRITSHQASPSRAAATMAWSRA